MPDIKVTVQSPPKVGIVVEKSSFLEVDVNQRIIEGITSSPVVFVVNEVPSGAINGSNSIFTTEFDFIQNYIWIYYNGLKLHPADYSLISASSFTLSDTPLAGDLITVDYIRTKGSVGLDNLFRLDENQDITPT